MPVPQNRAQAVKMYKIQTNARKCLVRGGTVDHGFDRTVLQCAQAVQIA